MRRYRELANFGAPKGQKDNSPGQRSQRPAPWGPIPSKPFSLFLFRADGCVGAKQEKGKIHYYSTNPGRRFALPWARVLLSFQDANNAHLIEIDEIVSICKLLAGNLQQGLKADFRLLL